MGRHSTIWSKTGNLWGTRGFPRTIRPPTQNHCLHKPSSASYYQHQQHGGVAEWSNAPVLKFDGVFWTHLDRSGPTSRGLCKREFSSSGVWSRAVWNGPDFLHRVTFLGLLIFSSAVAASGVAGAADGSKANGMSLLAKCIKRRMNRSLCCRTGEWPCDSAASRAEKLLRVRSHFRKSSALVLRRERHKTFEVLQHHRASSAATPIRPPVVAIKARGKIAVRRLGHLAERCFQNRGAFEVRLGL